MYVRVLTQKKKQKQKQINGVSKEVTMEKNTIAHMCHLLVIFFGSIYSFNKNPIFTLGNEETRFYFIFFIEDDEKAQFFRLLFLFCIACK